MKKALQIKHLRAKRSVSDRAVGRGPSERDFYGFRNRFAQVRIRDSGGHLGRLACVLGGDLDVGR
jgi:hypothetical protein